MADSLETATAAWFTELDDIDSSWYVTTFAHSNLGRLPPELLDGIVECVMTCDLPAVARISPRLRELAEKNLYTHIELCSRVDEWASLPFPRKGRLWSLHRTLKDRSDLAQMVRSFSAPLYDEQISIDLDASILFPGDAHFFSALKVSLHHTVIGGRILLEHLTNVEEVIVNCRRSFFSSDLWGSTETTRFKHLTTHPLEKLLPAFDSMTAHSLRYPGLQKLTSFTFSGSEFHWVLAKSPCLRRLILARPCVILSDEATNEVNSSLQTLFIAARSVILRKDSHRYAYLAPFLAHFPSLKELTIRIYDLGVDKSASDQDDVHQHGELDYTNLLNQISGVASQLTGLDIGPYKNAEDDDADVNEYLRQARPGPGFQNFVSLENLVVPYQCLLGHTFSSVDPLPSPAAILPPSLVLLTVHCPQAHIYDWLTRLEVVQDRLSALLQIELHCQTPYGDDYNVFQFVHHDHYVLGILEKIGIALYLNFRKEDWKRDWDDYDLKILDAVDWLDSLQA